MTDELRLARRVLLGGALGSLAACAHVPTVGPVEQVSPSAQASLERGVQVRPALPQVDGSPEVVMAGFIDALASLEPDFQVARQYLTPKAAASWDPLAGVTVFNGDERANLTSAESAALHAPLVGRLDAGGHFTSAAGQLAHDFDMAMVDGQWRIQNPPKGLLVSSFTMLHRFAPVQVWFLDRTGRQVVPELVWLAASPPTATQLVQALLQGPSEWLRPAVSAAFPASTKLSAPAVTIDADGVAEVPLTDAVANLPDAQRSQVAAQLLWTLRQLVDVQRLRISVAGKTWSMPGATADGSIGEADVMAWSPVAGNASQQPFALVRGVIGRMDAPNHHTPVAGSFGLKTWGDEAGAMAAHGATAKLAVVNRARTRLVVGPIDQPGVEQWLTGEQLGRPQFSGAGQVWLLTDGESKAPRLLRISAKGASQLVGVTLPKGHRLVRFSLSPEGTRLAVISESGAQRVLGLCLLQGSDPLAASGYRPLPLVDSQPLTWVSDVAWSSPTTLLVLAAVDKASRAGVVQIGCDGADLEALGPSGDADPLALVVQPTLRGGVAGLISKRGTFLTFESAWRWQGDELSVTTATYPR